MYNMLIGDASPWRLDLRVGCSVSEFWLVVVPTSRVIECVLLAVLLDGALQSKAFPNWFATMRACGTVPRMAVFWSVVALGGIAEFAAASNEKWRLDSDGLVDSISYEPANAHHIAAASAVISLHMLLATQTPDFPLFERVGDESYPGWPTALPSRITFLPSVAWFRFGVLLLAVALDCAFVDHMLRYEPAAHGHCLDAALHICTRPLPSAANISSGMAEGAPTMAEEVAGTKPSPSTANIAVQHSGSAAPAVKIDFSVAAARTSPSPLLLSPEFRRHCAGCRSTTYKPVSSLGACMLVGPIVLTAVGVGYLWVSLTRRELKARRLEPPEWAAKRRDDDELRMLGRELAASERRQRQREKELRGGWERWLSMRRLLRLRRSETSMAWPPKSYRARRTSKEYGSMPDGECRRPAPDLIASDSRSHRDLSDATLGFVVTLGVRRPACSGEKSDPCSGLWRSARVVGVLAATRCLIEFVQLLLFVLALVQRQSVNQQVPIYNTVYHIIRINEAKAGTPGA